MSGNKQVREANKKERTFSIELRSRSGLRNMSLADGAGDRVLVEGTIGELVSASFAEGVVLEVVGSNGTLRMDLGEGEIKKRVDAGPEVRAR